MSVVNLAGGKTPNCLWGFGTSLHSGGHPSRIVCATWVHGDWSVWGDRVSSGSKLDLFDLVHCLAKSGTGAVVWQDFILNCLFGR